MLPSLTAVTSLSASERSMSSAAVALASPVAASRSMTISQSGLDWAMASTEMSSPWWLSEPACSRAGVRPRMSNIGPMERPVPGAT